MENSGENFGGVVPSGNANNIDGIKAEPVVNDPAPGFNPVNQSNQDAANHPQGAPVYSEPVQEMPSPAPSVVIDEPKKKSHKGVIIFLIVLIVLISVGFLFYYLLSTQAIKNDWFPGNEPEKPVQPEPSEKPQKKFSDYDGSLDFSFLKMEDKKENLIYSPLSVKYALSLLNDGAAGETKEQIETVLDGTELTKYENIEDKLSLANAVFIKNDFKDSVKKEYINGAAEKYNADVLYDEFTDARAIDSWIDTKTFGLIKDSGVDVGSDTKMVLANALAIQLDWKKQFNVEVTSGENFEYKDGEDETTMMHEAFSGTEARLYDDGEVSAVAMDLEPIGSTELEFVAIMPEEDLSNFIDKTDGKIENVLDGMVAVEDYDEVVSDSSQDVKAFSKLDYLNVYIPKFKFDYELESFKEELQALGVKNAFSSEADFSEMAEKPLYVSQAIHKANIDFSEDGIKAAAITIFVTEIMSALGDPDPYQPVVKTITFDKPFMFIIRDKNTGEKWFVGTVYEPNRWADDKEEYMEGRF